MLFGCHVGYRVIWDETQYEVRGLKLFFQDCARYGASIIAIYGIYQRLGDYPTPEDIYNRI